MRLISAQEVTASKNCVAHGCAFDVEKDSDYCRIHQPQSDPLARLYQTALKPCKTPGCPNSANIRYTNGIFANLCEEVCIPVQRELASERARDRHAESKGAPAGPVKTWTKEAVINALEGWAAEHGRFPTSSEVPTRDNGDYPTYAIVRRFFSSWADALEASGCPGDVPSGQVVVSPSGQVTVTTEAARRGDEPPLSPPVPPQPRGLLEEGAMEGMRATYIELLLLRLENFSVHTDAAKLMNRIERLLWDTP